MITLTIPPTRGALIKRSHQLNALASMLRPGQTGDDAFISAAQGFLSIPIPEAVAPVAPEAVAPVAPEAATPVAPEAVAPVAPEAATPVAPEAVAPVAPEAVAPVAPVAPEAVAPEAVAPEAVAPVAPEAVAIDSAGVGWDRRYHASTKTKMASGHWKMKKGLGEADKAIAIALRAPEAATPVAPEAVAPVAPEAVAPVAPVAPEAAAKSWDFPSLVAAVTGRINAGTLTAPEVVETLTAMGVNGGLPSLVAAPDKLAAAAAALGL